MQSSEARGRPQSLQPEGKSRNDQTHSRPYFITGWGRAFVLSSGRHRNPPLDGLGKDHSSESRIPNCSLSLPFSAQHSRALVSDTLRSHLSRLLGISRPQQSLNFETQSHRVYVLNSFYCYVKIPGSEAAPVGKGFTSSHNVWSIVKGHQDRNSTRTDTEAREECCLLDGSPLLAQCTFL